MRQNEIVSAPQKHSMGNVNQINLAFIGYICGRIEIQDIVFTTYNLIDLHWLIKIWNKWSHHRWANQTIQLSFVCFIYPLLILWSSVHASTILWKWYFYWLKTAQNFTHNMFLLTRMQKLNVIPLIWKPLKCRTICTLSDYK